MFKDTTDFQGRRNVLENKISNTSKDTLDDYLNF